MEPETIDIVFRVLGILLVMLGQYLQSRKGPPPTGKTGEGKALPGTKTIPAAHQAAVTAGAALVLFS